MRPVGRIKGLCANCAAHAILPAERALMPNSPSRVGTRLWVLSCREAHSIRQQPSLRYFSTASNRYQSSPLSHDSRSPEEVEQFVRDARQRFRDTLPKGYLTDAEYQLYERLYGPPLRETRPEDMGIALKEKTYNVELVQESAEEMLLRELEQRAVLAETEEASEQIEAVDEIATDLEPQIGLNVSEDLDVEIVNQAAEDSSEVEYIYATSRSKREYDALSKLQGDFERARLQGLEDAGLVERENLEEASEEEAGEAEAGEQEDNSGEPGYGFARPGNSRQHPLTLEGKFGTHPRSILFSKEAFIQPVHTLLGRTPIGHVADAAEKVFGGPGLPYSPATPESKKNLPMKPIGLEAGQPKMTEIEADAYVAAFLPPAAASVAGVLVEVRKRLGPDWLRNLFLRGGGEGPRVLDVGGGGAGLLAWRDILNAEWAVLRDAGETLAGEPPSKQTVVVGSNNLRHRISRFLSNTSFIPRLPDYRPLDTKGDHIDSTDVTQPRKSFDIIIASHQLLPVAEGHRRKAVLNQLWSLLSPVGGVLIVLEKGHPRGFEAVADVRQRLLDEFLITPGSQSSPPSEQIEPEPSSFPLRVREPGMIIAPCTNHKHCPMYLTPGKSAGRKDFCHFSQRYVRPHFLQTIMGASTRNHDDVDFSYIAIQRGVSPPQGLPVGEDATRRAFDGYNARTDLFDMRALPRSVLPPIKRTGHVTLDLCTPSGHIERWTIPKSFGKQAYHDARKAQWGDLWALGAKTRVQRQVRMGRSEVLDDGGVRAQRAKAGNKPRIINLGFSGGGMSAEETHGLKGAPVQRRTKGGKKPPRRTLLDELEEEV